MLLRIGRRPPGGFRRNPVQSQHHFQRWAMKEESSYVCDSCGEEIVVPIDLSAGSEQEYVEDCPVCCHPNVIHVEVDETGDVRVWAERE
jgi:hypothetical protein